MPYPQLHVDDLGDLTHAAILIAFESLRGGSTLAFTAWPMIGPRRPCLIQHFSRLWGGGRSCQPLNTPLFEVQRNSLLVPEELCWWATITANSLTESITAQVSVALYRCLLGYSPPILPSHAKRLASHANRLSQPPLHPPKCTTLVPTSRPFARLVPVCAARAARHRIAPNRLPSSIFSIAHLPFSNPRHGIRANASVRHARSTRNVAAARFNLLNSPGKLESFPCCCDETHEPARSGKEATLCRPLESSQAIIEGRTSSTGTECFGRSLPSERRCASVTRCHDKVIYVRTGLL